jgi:hypothetical protein
MSMIQYSYFVHWSVLILINLDLHNGSSNSHLVEGNLQLLAGLVHVEYGELVDVGDDCALYRWLILLQAVLN